MTLMPCNTCRLKATCELRAEKRRLLRGAKLTSARFDCQLQRDDMPPGAVVEARLKYVWQGTMTHDYEGESTSNTFTVPGPWAPIPCREVDL